VAKVDLAAKWTSVTVRKIAIVAAAVAAVAAGSSAGASARGMHGFSRMGAATPGFSRFAGPHRFAFRHRFRHRFAFFGAAVPYGYDEGCYTRVWTRGGWRWTSVCD
jgi:hypothetical protein